MSMAIDETLPPRLVEALRGRGLVVVTGAGISVAPPSDLPSWWGFNTALFESIKARASETLPGQRELLDSLSLDGPVSAFSDLVVRTFAGDGFFPLLTALESARPNANHAALARLAAQGIVSDIVTFNFDTLIEQAFRDAKVPLEVFVNSADYERLDLEQGFGPRLHKVHGSVTDAKSLIDTVTQKLRGLSSQRRLLLASLFRSRHILFLGFSGADFDFGSDYLPMGANREGEFGFTWLHRGTRPTVAARLAREDGIFLAGSLPDFFERMGVVTDPVPSTTKEPADIRAGIDAWTRKPSVGPWACASLCQRLAFETGQEAIGRALDDALAARLMEELQAQRFDLTMTGAMRRLALSALESGDIDRALAWSGRELQAYEWVNAILTAGGQKPSPQARLEYLRNAAAAYSNIGLAHAHSGRPGGLEAAREAFLKAQAQLVDAQDHDTEALLLFNKAVHLETEPDAKLRALRKARAHAREAGAGRTQIEAACAEAQLLLELSELDLAIEAAVSVEPLLPIAGNVSHDWQYVLIRIEAWARRGNWDEGLTLCETALSKHRPSPGLALRIARQVRKLLTFNSGALDGNYALD
jgi:tetratricopeptide (TPR) repeat protein